MIKIAPSLLSADFACLKDDIETVSTADMLHFDVMDGSFVPNISVGLPVLRSVRACTDMELDVHLMIVEPSRYAVQFAKAGADWVTFHVEAEKPENIGPTLDAIRAEGKRCGLVLKPATPADAVAPWIDKVDMILVMTVEPGFGGQGFMADMLPKIRRVKELIGGRSIRLEVDGGINPDTAALCREAGADTLVAGSDVFKQSDRALRIKQLRG